MFCASKNTNKRVKKQPTNGKIYKDLLRLSNRQDNFKKRTDKGLE